MAGPDNVSTTTAPRTRGHQRQAEAEAEAGAYLTSHNTQRKRRRLASTRRTTTTTTPIERVRTALLVRYQNIYLLYKYLMQFG